jgi:NAD(P)-dependent dehydrogenase (short-subunit alcohol dehydrogenase family)
MKQIVLITGAAGGIGMATVKVFSDAGWYTIGVDRFKPDDVGYTDLFIKTDLSNPESARSTFENLQKQEGRLDALINNAAVQLVKPLTETKPAEWDNVMAHNVRTAFLSIKYVYPLMCNQGGSIINISSVHAVATSENLAAYVTSKGALVALTRAAALELTHANIRVNAILPGAIDTKMLRSGLSRDHVAGDTIEKRLELLGRKHALGRVGKPQEIGETALFLADNRKSSFMTGQTIIVDGGATARLSTE